MALGGEKQITTVEITLDDQIKNRLRNLKVNGSFARGWVPSAETSAALKPLREKYDRYMGALTAHREGTLKGKDGKVRTLTDNEQIALSNGATSVANEMKVIVLKAINAEGTRIRSMINAFAKAQTPDRSYSLKVKTSVKVEDCAFQFTAHLALSLTDAADGVLETL